MTRRLLDTTALVDFARGLEPSTAFLKQLLASGDEIGVCPVTVAEFFAGLQPHRHHDWSALLSALRFWPISYAASVQAGTWRYAFARQGIQIGSMDALVAAVAIEMGATIVTSNGRHFPMGIPILDPRAWTP